jgi:solute carrier family 13 (sodium-dependent dicarboxylate transporter), member 2/3/5
MNESYSVYKRAALIAGPALFVLILAAPAPEGMSPEAKRVAATAVLMALWWITEAIPIPATALIPLGLFPMLGVMDATEVGPEYGHPTIWLFAGGFFIAMAMQKWNLHERIALKTIRLTGTNLHGLVFGFMLATAFLSMWISNTATCVMMVPIGMAVIDQLQKNLDPARVSNFSVAVMLGIAYASSIGGIATLVGTPPNGVLVAQMDKLFGQSDIIGFGEWFIMALPMTVVFLPVTWVLLTRVLFPLGKSTRSLDAEQTIADRLAGLGAMNRGEKIVLAVAVAAALSWIFRKELNFGFVTVPGWGELFPESDFLHDGTVAIFYTVVLFLIPVDWKKGEFALDWEWAKRIPWGILILFGGGLALAGAFEATGLVEWVGGKLELLGGVPPIVMVLAVALLMTFTTEMTSNTATTSIMLPILAAAASQALGVHPLLLMIPATISASCAFMLPVATPPNAIIFGSGQVTVQQMARAGLILNLIGVVLVTLTVYTLGIKIFGITPTELPAWAGDQGGI